MTSPPKVTVVKEKQTHQEMR